MINYQYWIETGLIVLFFITIYLLLILYPIIKEKYLLDKESKQGKL